MDTPANSGGTQVMEFQAEVKQLLDIVINSLYTEREIFVRELVSNASDALEKYRLISLVDSGAQGGSADLEINIETDEKKNTLTIRDNGIGMTRDELVANLGTIAHSGSMEFVRRMAERDQQDLNLIGQFGVGFYSAFMAASSVRVRTLSHKDQAGWEWESEGSGSFTIRQARVKERGTSITLNLKEDAREYAAADTIRGIIRRYSNFVPFPILLNGDKVNTISAIWTRNKNEITDLEYNEFYKYMANTMTDPYYRLHLSTDAPIQINALFFIPADNFESYGMGRLEPGVSLYSRKVLIQQGSRDILPEYLRFVKGVADSEDLPLNISRETAQESRLVKKMSRFLTRRILSFLEEEMSRDRKKYDQFWESFAIFIKEGCVSDAEYRDQLAALLLFQSSSAETGLVSLDQYAGRMVEGQKEIYYLNGSGREAIESGPYMEVFKERGIEVLYLTDSVDDFVMTAVREYKGKKLVSADQADLELPSVPKAEKREEEKGNEGSLTSEELTGMIAWFKEVLGDAFSEVRLSSRLVGSPAMVVNPDPFMTTSMQRVLKAANSQLGGMQSPKVLEINPKNGLIIKLAMMRQAGAGEAILKDCAEQIAENALLAAGISGEGLKSEKRILRIMEYALDR